MNKFRFTGRITRIKTGEGKNGPYCFGTVAAGAQGAKDYSQLDFKCFDAGVVAELDRVGVGNEVTIEGELGGSFRVEGNVKGIQAGQAAPPPPQTQQGFDEVPF